MDNEEKILHALNDNKNLVQSLFPVVNEIKNNVIKLENKIDKLENKHDETRERSIRIEQDAQNFERQFEKFENKYKDDKENIYIYIRKEIEEAKKVAAEEGKKAFKDSKIWYYGTFGAVVTLLLAIYGKMK